MSQLDLAGCDEAPLWYDKRLNIVFGQSESGKTWLCALAALDCIRRLRLKVLWLDAEEPGRPQIADRLVQLGASENELAMVICNSDIIPEMVTKKYGDRIVDHGLVNELVAMIKANDVGLVVIDSYGELAGSQDLDDDRQPDLSFLKTRVLAHIIKVACLVLIDHTGHTTGAREKGSKFKRNTTDGSSLFVETVQPFRPGKGGEARIWAMKDRHGGVYAASKLTPTMLPGETKTTERHFAGILKMSPKPGTWNVDLSLIAPQDTDLPNAEGLVARHQGIGGTELIKQVIADQGGTYTGREELFGAVQDRLPEDKQYALYSFDRYIRKLRDDGHLKVTKVGREHVYGLLIGMNGKTWRNQPPK